MLAYSHPKLRKRLHVVTVDGKEVYRGDESAIARENYSWYRRRAKAVEWIKDGERYKINN